jgi:hypothetical protein
MCKTQLKYDLAKGCLTTLCMRMALLFKFFTLTTPYSKCFFKTMSWIHSGIPVSLKKGEKRPPNAQFTLAELLEAQPLGVSGEKHATDINNKIQVRIEYIKNKGNSRGVVAATKIRKGTIVATCGPMKKVYEKSVSKYKKWSRYIWKDREDKKAIWVPTWLDPEHICFYGLLLNTPNENEGEVKNCQAIWFPIKRFGRIQDELVIIATKTIQPGQELMIDYGPEYSRLLLQERKAIVKKKSNEEEKTQSIVEIYQIYSRKNIGRGIFYFVRYINSLGQVDREGSWVNQKILLATASNAESRISDWNRVPEKVLDRKIVGTNLFYLIKWKGQDVPVWTKRTNLVRHYDVFVEEAIEDYDEDHPIWDDN